MRSLVLEYLDEVYRDLSGDTSGSVADYIPELAIVDPESFAICLSTNDGYLYEAGDTSRPFAIQSISKPFTYALALADRGLDVVAAKVDVEPSGEPFNEISLDALTERPRNPMINAGAITCASLIEGDSVQDRFERLRTFYSRCAGRDLRLDEEMFESEDRSGHRNRAIGYMLRSFGILDEDPQTTLGVYFRQCSIEVDCRDLSRMAATLANSGVCPVTRERVLEPAITERVLSVMTTCGMYNSAGDWVTEVGLPAKSGFGGGIIAVLPGQLGLAVFSPRLDEHGNSVRGVRAFQRLSRDLELHFMHVSRAARSAVRASFDVIESPSRRRRSPQEQAVLLQYGRRARVYELHGDLLFAATESVIREITEAAGDLDVVVLDVRSVDETAAVSRRLLLGLRAQLARSGGESVLVDPARAVRGPVPDASGALHTPGERDMEVKHFPDLNAALEYAEDQLIARYGGATVTARRVDVLDHALLAGLPDDQVRLIRSRMVARSYRDGEAVVRSGQEAHGLFLVLSGMIDVSVERGEVRHHLSMFTPSTTFGTVYAVSRRSYDIDAHARGPVQALLLPTDAIGELGETAPDLMLTVHRRLLTGAFDYLDWVTRALVAGD